VEREPVNLTVTVLTLCQPNNFAARLGLGVGNREIVYDAGHLDSHVKGTITIGTANRLWLAVNSGSFFRSVRRDVAKHLFKKGQLVDLSQSPANTSEASH
jgi:hypothetical protein